MQPDVYAFQCTNGAWIICYAVDGEEREYPRQFPTENAAMLFAALNAGLLK